MPIYKVIIEAQGEKQNFAILIIECFTVFNHKTAHMCNIIYNAFI